MLFKIPQLKGLQVVLNTLLDLKHKKQDKIQHIPIDLPSGLKPILGIDLQRKGLQHSDERRHRKEHVKPLFKPNN